MSELSLRQIVHKALKKERQAIENQSEAHKARRFGLFLQASLREFGLE